jgi:hypothetical protein
VKLERLEATGSKASKRLNLKTFHLRFAAVMFVVPLACYAGRSLGADRAQSTAGSTEVKDITNKKLDKRGASCLEYLGSYSSSSKDVKRGVSFKGSLTITRDQNKCVFTSNSIPNHDFNDGSKEFVNAVREVTETYEIPAEPQLVLNPAWLTTSYDNGILLNGVKLDLLSAACYCVGDEPLGQEQIGCLTMAWGWRYDPMSPKNSFGADTHNAHAQPDGAYHYHGSPHALFEETKPQGESPVIGFAADGFPIYGPYIKKNGELRKVKSSYALREGARKPIPNQRCFPGGVYDGRFREDYVFIPNLGDLDECNGMMRDGKYGYYVTDGYPYVMACFKGTPDGSFRKKSDDEHAH